MILRARLHRALDRVLDWRDLRDLRSAVRDAVEFKENQHPRDKSGKFKSGAGESGAAQPSSVTLSGGITVEKGGATNPTAFVKKQLAAGKLSPAEIATAASTLFNKDITKGYVGYVKSYEAKKAAKKAGIAANNNAIKAAAQNPMPAAKMNAELTAQEKKGYKTLYASCTDASGAKVFCKVPDVPPGIDKQEYIALALAKQGLKVQLTGEFNPAKPAPPGGYKDVSIPPAEIQGLKDLAYAKAKAEAAANRKVTESEEHLPPAIVQSIKHYTNGSYGDLNRNLRQGKPMNEAQATLAAHLDEALAKSKTVEDIVVYRGLGSGAEKFFGDSVTVGTVLIDNGYISTSKAKDKSFNGTKCRINVKKGSRAIDVSTMSLHSHEKEVLLPRGSMFKVTGVAPTGEVELEYISK